MIGRFFLSGSLGGLSVGNSKKEVLGLLGEAGARSEGNGRTEIWKYNDLEVAFDRGAVYSIGLYFENGTAALPQTLSAGQQLKVEAKRLEDFKSYLSANGIDFAFDESLTFDEQACLRISQSGVGVYFVQDELHSIQFSKDALPSALKH